ncbi:MAG: hypothetical protein E6Q44_10050 [Flavobacteriales bacterium]|nr:MAG: hypothetical protein E6Q44_10050 [Flavobacteriales bacterium]
MHRPRPRRPPRRRRQPRPPPRPRNRRRRRPQPPQRWQSLPRRLPAWPLRWATRSPTPPRCVIRSTAGWPSRKWRKPWRIPSGTRSWRKARRPPLASPLTWNR